MNKTIIVAIAIVMAATKVNAQQATFAAADSALNVCDADKADRLYSEILSSGQRPADALTGKARVTMPGFGST